jgi:hypothetical protein
MLENRPWLNYQILCVTLQVSFKNLFSKFTLLSSWNASFLMEKYRDTNLVKIKKSKDTVVDIYNPDLF